MIISPPALARKAARILAAAAVALSLAGLAQEDSAEAQAQQEALQRLRARIDAVQQGLERDRSRQDDARRKLETTERRLVNLNVELRRLRKRINEQTAQLRKTTAERAAAETALRRERAVLGQQVRASYIIGQHGKAKLLLTQDGTSRLSRVMTYYDYLNRARAGRMRDIQTQAEALAAAEARLKVETTELQATRSQQLGTLTALEGLQAERQQIVRELNEHIAGGETELARLRQEERDMQSLLKELHSALADIPADLGSKPFVRLKGKLPWPVSGRLLAAYGQPKAGGALKWNGVWIAGREGAPVRAVARGRVAYVGWMHRYGLITVLEHEGGYYSLYGHAQSVAVAVGDWVQAGDTIAAVGNTGGHLRPGLYFELRKGTDAVNPSVWLRRRTATAKG